MDEESRSCQNCKEDFRIDSEDFAFYARVDVPPPTFCSECRKERRLASRNQRSLYKRACSKCGANVPSMYHPESDFIVYCTDCYFSDSWDPMDAGTDYDFSLPFFPQFYELMKKVPQIHIEHQNNNAGNIVFSNYVYRSKDVYLSYGIIRGEGIYYSWGAENGNRQVYDSLSFSDNENCYDIVSSTGNYNCSFLTRSHACIDSSFLFDCTNCTNCFMSANLRNKSNVFRGRQLSAEAYKEAMKQFREGSRTLQFELEREYEALMHGAIRRAYLIVHSEACTGDFITNSKNAKDSFMIQDAQDIRFGQNTTNKVTDCYDFCMAGRAESSYEFCVVGRGNSHLLFSYNVGNTLNSEYCDACDSIENCFGCVGIRNKSFCIFNKQYSEEEYKQLRAKIVEQMNEMPYVDGKGTVYRYGEYFPVTFSRFAFNETTAFEFAPRSKEDVLAMEYSYREVEQKSHKPTVRPEDIPEKIADVTDGILSEILPCEHSSDCDHNCTNAFRMIREELDMYRRLKIPIPRLCPNCRYFERFSKRVLPWKLWKRECMCDIEGHGHNGTCANAFETSYAPERPETVYCESCYQKEVV